MTYDDSRLRRLALISLALQSAGRIEGRTKLQKMLYLANLAGWNAIDFKYHNYGPYSDTLTSELENMRNYGWILERQSETSQERILYSYSFSSKHRQVGASLVGKVLEVNPQLQRLISRTRGLIKQLNGFSSDDLEVMSTLMFLRKQNPVLSNDKLVNLTHTLKPHFSREEITAGLRIFNIMQDHLPRSD